MMRHDHNPIARRVATTLALLACCLPLAAAEPAAAPLVVRQYQLRFLGTSEGVAVATGACQEGTCLVGSAGPSALEVRTDLATQERIAKALHEADLPPADQAFQLILLQADRSGSGDPGPLPAGARKALADLSEFLPYSRYQLLGSAFVRTTRDARVVVEGTGDRSYEVSLRFRGDARAASTVLMVDQFLLRLIPADVLGLLMGTMAPADRGGAPHPTAAKGSRTPAPSADHSAAAGGPTSAPASPTANPTPAAAPVASSGPVLAQNLLDTSFSLRRGETVVVGTSKLDGGSSALVVLLTALP